MAESKLAVVAALFANLLIAVLKLAAGVFSRSAAMLAEAAHSFSDVGNQILLLVGMRNAARPPTLEHPFGTGKAAYFWPFMVAILLFGAAGAYSAFEGIDKIRHPHEVSHLWLSLGVLGASFAIEIGSLVIALREAVRSARRRGITSIRQFLDENRDAALLTVLVEDSLALVGLPIAALALALSFWTGNPIWDGVGSLTIGLILMGFALFLGNEVKALLIGRGLTPRDREKLAAILALEPNVRRIVSLQSMYLGPDAVMLGCELELDMLGSGADVTDLLRRIESDMRAQVPALRFVFLEPQRASA